MAEIGESVMCFSGVPYIANIGCVASPEETYPIIYDGVREALHDYEGKCGYPEQEAYSCKLRLTEGYHFERPESFPIQTALSLFGKVHEYISK